MASTDVVIVGAGLAGLACAHHLQASGLDVTVFDGADAVGGRLRTDEVDGFLLDRGFQTVLTGYPEVQALIDLEALDARRFLPGALTRVNGKMLRVEDPLRRPRKLLSTALSPVGTLADKLRVLRLRQSVTRPSLDRLWSREEMTTRRALTDRYHFSSSILGSFFEPFLTGVLLDPDLNASSRAFEFYFRMFAVGHTVIPARGMQRIPEQLAARLPGKSIQVDSRVRKARPQSVVLESGEEIRASAVVLAVEAPELAYLLDGFEPPESRSTCCLYFATEEPPHDEPVLVLNGEGKGPVNNLVTISAVSDQLAPAGQHLVSTSVPGNPGLTDEELEQRVRMQMRDWYGNVVDTWRLLKIYRVLHALPSQEPPALSPPRRPSRLPTGHFICGDHRTNASINGALESGRFAAEAVTQALGR